MTSDPSRSRALRELGRRGALGALAAALFCGPPLRSLLEPSAGLGLALAGGGQGASAGPAQPPRPSAEPTPAGLEGAQPAPLAAPAQLDESTPRLLRFGQSELELELDSAEFTLPRERIVQWVTNSAEIVRRYYGVFPAERVRVVIAGRPGRGVGPGKTLGPGRLTIRVGIGLETTEVELERDWVMIHELVHLALPVLRDEHDWLTEGLATYVEPVARGQAGQMSAARVWEDLLGGMPKGLPKEGDRGLDFTPTWGRTYWGGALFCLQADVEIRRRTQNRFGLQHALRAIVASGGSFAVRWPIERALAVGDEAVGVPVLSELYQQLRAAPVAPDLAALSQELGVVLSAGRAQFDDAAPLADVRQSITAAPPEH